MATFRHLLPLSFDALSLSFTFNRMFLKPAHGPKLQLKFIKHEDAQFLDTSDVLVIGEHGIAASINGCSDMQCIRRTQIVAPTKISLRVRNRCRDRD